MENLTDRAFAQRLGATEHAQLFFEATRSGVLSWNTHAPRGRLAFRLLRARNPASAWLDHSEWQPGGATSLSPSHDGTTVEIDVVRSALLFDGIEVRAPGVHFELVAFSAPVRSRDSLPYAREALILDVPALSQYTEEPGSAAGAVPPASR